jgi:hypothetical protein
MKIRRDNGERDVISFVEDSAKSAQLFADYREPDKTVHLRKLKNALRAIRARMIETRKSMRT